jgi:hypothetical protein
MANRPHRIGLALLLLCLLIWPLASVARAQRVLECHFVSVTPDSFVYGQWSFAADISGGFMHLLLARPQDSDPTVTAFRPLDQGRSIHTALDAGTSDGGTTANFEMATVGPGELVTLDQWQFGATEQHDRLILRCPSHT